MEPLSATEDPSALADWMELAALATSDREVSAQDFINAVKRGGSEQQEALDEGSPILGPDKTIPLEALADAAFSELLLRATACGSNKYPFRVSRHGTLEALGGAEDTVYGYLLNLSQGYPGAATKNDNCAKDFEELSLYAARSYFGCSEGRAFGFPRRYAATHFPAALEDLCPAFGDSLRPSTRPAIRAQKDGKLDVVAWSPFNDRVPVHIIVMGQCAIGATYSSKLFELQPESFAQKWLNGHPQAKPMRAFFTPFRLPPEELKFHSIDAGILFDRCRIAAHSQAAPANEIRQWIGHLEAKRTSRRSKRAA